MKAAILERIGEPLRIVDLEVPKLEAGQVLVKVLCTGICGSQLQEIDGIKGDPAHLPHTLGHEGCGIVEDTGLGVTHVKRGDKVVMHWRKGAGMEAVLPIYNELILTDHGNQVEYTRAIKAGPITTFSEYSIVIENRVTKIDDDVPNDLAALLGCALSTAVAIIENEAKPKPNESVFVIGCGGVGLAIILASKTKTNKVYAFDKSDLKRPLVLSLGAEWIQDNPLPWEIVIDTVGALWLDYPGVRHISLQPGGTSAGGFNPTKDIPRYVQMWRDGLLDDYPKLITHRIRLDEINKGISLMRDGKAGRVMIEMQ